VRIDAVRSNHALGRPRPLRRRAGRPGRHSRGPARTRARSLRQAGIEREARRALDETSVARLESLGILRGAEPAEVRAEIRELAASLGVVEELQVWVERRLFDAGDEAA